MLSVPVDCDSPNLIFVGCVEQVGVVPVVDSSERRMWRGLWGDQLEFAEICGGRELAGMLYSYQSRHSEEKGHTFGLELCQLQIVLLEENHGKAIISGRMDRHAGLWPHHRKRRAEERRIAKVVCVPLPLAVMSADLSDVSSLIAGLIKDINSLSRVPKCNRS